MGLEDELLHPGRPNVRRAMNPHSNTATKNLFDDIGNLQ
jgi:hypothetical protein